MESHLQMSPPKPTAFPAKSGYILKKDPERLRTTWERRYFVLKGNTLHYYNKSKEDRTSIDLRICMVREVPNSDRRFCFEIVSPTKYVHSFRRNFNSS